jgi:hypothetical protein
MAVDGRCTEVADPQQVGLGPSILQWCSHAMITMMW